MTTTPMISRHLHQSNHQSNRLQSRVPYQAKIFAQVSLPSRKYNQHRAKVRTTFGKRLKKSFPGAILRNIKPNEKSTGLDSTWMETGIFLWLRLTKACVMLFSCQLFLPLNPFWWGRTWLPRISRKRRMHTAMITLRKVRNSEYCFSTFANTTSFSLRSTKSTTAKTNVLTSKSFWRLNRCWNAGALTPATWISSGGKRIKTARVRSCSLSLWIGHSTNSLTWTMTTMAKWERTNHPPSNKHSCHHKFRNRVLQSLLQQDRNKKLQDQPKHKIWIDWSTCGCSSCSLFYHQSKQRKCCRHFLSASMQWRMFLEA